MKTLYYLTLAILISLPAAASAHGPTRQKVEETITLTAPTDKVWEVVGDFSGLHNWHPAIKSTRMEGDTVRVLTLAGEGEPTITEELKKLDDDNMMMKYKIIDMSVVKSVAYRGKQYDVPVLPVNNYLSIIKVKAVEGGSEVTWTGKFYRVYMLNYDTSEPRYPEGLGDKEAVETIRSVYRSGLDNLKTLVEGGG